MSTVSGASSATHITEINSLGALTPDMLMLYCSTRIGSIDDQVKEHFQKQEKFRAASAAVNKLTALYQERSANNGLYFRSDAGDPQVTKDAQAKFDALEAVWNEAEAALPAGSKELSELHEQRMSWGRSMSSELGGDTKFSKGECADMATNLGNIGKDLNQSAELDMMQLQSLMSQRQTAVQMCTNLVSSLGETTKSIAQKIGS